MPITSRTNKSVGKPGRTRAERKHKNSGFSGKALKAKRARKVGASIMRSEVNSFRSTLVRTREKLSSLMKVQKYELPKRQYTYRAPAVKIRRAPVVRVAKADNAVLTLERIKKVYFTQEKVISTDDSMFLEQYRREFKGFEENGICFFEWLAHYVPERSFHINGMPTVHVQIDIKMKDNPTNHVSIDRFKGSKTMLLPTFVKLLKAGFRVYSNAFQLPQMLYDALVTPRPDISSINYNHPPIDDRRKEPTLPTIPEPFKRLPRLPKRIALPIIEFPTDFVTYLKTGNLEVLKGYMANKLGDLVLLRKSASILFDLDLNESTNVTIDIHDVLQFCKQKFTNRNFTDSKVAQSLAAKALKMDLGLAAMRDASINIEWKQMPTWPAFLYIIQKMRAGCLIKKNEVAEFLKPIDQNHEEIIIRYTIYGEIYLSVEYLGKKSQFYMNANYFLWKTTGDNKLIFGDSDTMDYSVTHTEVVFNLEVIKACREYKDFEPLITHLIKLQDIPIPYNRKVTIMKNYEALCLMRSDVIDEKQQNGLSKLISWDPIIGTINDFLSAYYGTELPLFDRMAHFSAFCGTNVLNKSKSWALDLLKILTNLSGVQLQEASAMHKFFYYAQVDETKGFMKYLKRVHTPRPFKQDRITDLVNLAKRMFTLNFHKRHHILPQINGPEDKLKLLTDLLKSGNKRQLEAKPLTWWSDLSLSESLSKPSTYDPLEKAKDKGALLPEVAFGPGDSRKELLQVIERSKYELTPLPIAEYNGEREPLVYRTEFANRRQRLRCPTRLIAKEREQKIEARLFGNTTIDNKHGLSYYMDLMKVVLSYFDGEIMTISDKDRKLLIHKAGQLLLEKNYYSILLDIEGHNQSMQFGNVGPLAEFCGSLFGETGWANLTKYFNELTVYYYHIYKNDVYVSQGQKGGIEGWQNPLWTLHTTLVVQLLIAELQWNSPIQMIYSDDVGIITELRMSHQSQLDEFFDEVVHFFLDFGMVVKPIQTAISKNRITMLRNHYFRGLKSDSTLKRLLATTSFNDDQLVSEEIEVAGISSSISSAMEHTNHLTTCLYMKWYKIMITVLRAQAALFVNERENSMLSEEVLGKEISSFLIKYNIDKDLSWHVENAHKTGLADDLLKAGQEAGLTKLDSSELGQFLVQLYRNPINVDVSRMKVDMMMYLIKTNSFLQEIIIYRTFMPEDLGGYGLNFLVTQAISGHSSGKIKQLYYLKRLIDTQFQNRKFFYQCLENALGEKIKFMDDSNPKKENQKLAEKVQEAQSRVYDPSRVLGSEYPSINDLTTSTGHINSAIRKFIRIKSKNVKVLQLLALEDNQKVFKENLVEIFKKKLTYRVARFFYEHSKYHILDLLVSKIESSRGFLKIMPQVRSLRAKLFKLSLTNGVFLFGKARKTFGEINENTDIITYMIEMRRKCFPTVNFIEIAEPLYDHLLITSESSHPLIMSHFHKGTQVERGTEKYLAPEFGNEALYKGALEERISLFSTVEQMLSFKVVMMAKWILTNSLLRTDIITEYKKSSIEFAADYTLSTFNAPCYKALEHLVSLPRGGEIMHRLPNMQYKTGSNIRVLPNEITKVTTVINQSLIHMLNLEDTNINFDYLRFRVQLACSLQSLYSLNPHFISRYGLNITSLIQNVQIDFQSEVQGLVLSDKFNYSQYTFKALPLLETRVISEIYFNSENEIVSASIPSVHLIEAIGTKQLFSTAELIINEFHTLRHEQMFVSSVYSQMTPWLPFINRYKKLLVEWVNLDDKLIFHSIIDTLKQTARNNNMRGYTLDMDIDNTLLKRMLLEELEILDYDMDPILNRLMNLISITRDPGQIERWKNQNPGLAYNYTHDEVLSGSILVRLVMIIIIKYCLVTYHIGDRLFIDENATELNFYTTYTIRDELFPIGSPEFFFFRFYPVDMIDTYAARHLQRLIGLIAETCNIFSANDVRIIKLEKESDTHITLGRYLTHPPEALGIKYRMTWIDNSLIEYRTEYRKLFATIRSLSSLYADPIVAYSPTGSDSFTAAYGLLNCLLFSDWIDHETNICDLTAGRGDGRLAADLLHLKMTSYSRDDIFNKINRADGVVLIPGLDITDQNTLMFTLAYDHIHLDLSHFKGEGAKLIDTLVFYQNAAKTITIRLNNLFSDDIDLTSILERTDYEFKIAYPHQSNLKPYQVYLCLRPTTDGLYATVDSLLESELFRRLTMNYYSMARLDNMYISDVQSYHNSAVEAINLDITFELLIEQLTEEHEGHQLLSQYQKVIRNWSNIQLIDMVPENLPKKIREQLSEDDILYGSNIISRMADLYRAYPVNEKTIGYKPNQARYKKLSHHLGELHRGSNNIWSKAITMMTMNELEIVRSYHPIQEIRSSVNAVIDMIQQNNDPRDKMLDELIEEKLQYHKSIEHTPTAWSLNFKKALMALCIGVAGNDYNIGLTYLLQEYYGDRSHRAKAQTSLEIYRKLGALYNSLRSSFYLSLSTINALHKITGEFRRATAKRHVLERERHPEILDVFLDDSKQEFPDSFFEEIARNILNGLSVGNLVPIDSFLDTHLKLNDPPENVQVAVDLTMDGFEDMLGLDDFGAMMNQRVAEHDLGDDRLAELIGSWF